jgi:glycosyltransferase involved in cell wall biosynthesis
MAVERDSRTFKQASSLARLGYRSIVVEGEASGLAREDLPFELITIPGAAPSWGSTTLQAAEDGAPAEGPAAAGGPVPAVASPPAEERVDPVRRAWRRWRLFKNRQIVRVKAATYPLRWHLAWNRTAYRALPDADLLILHGYSLAPAVLMRAARARTPLSYDAHDAYFEIAPSQSRLTRGGRAWALVERLCVRFAKQFVTVSHGVARVLEERFGRRPTVIRNCHDLRLDEPAGRELREAAGLGDEQFLLVSIGNNKEGMEVEAALRALTRLDEGVHLAFVGRGHESTRELAERLGVADRLHLVGHVAPTQVASFAASADAAAVLYRPLTRSYESALPNGFFQGLAAGLPTLYPSGLPELAALAQRRELGLPIDPTEARSIADGVERLRSDPASLDRFRENARRAREDESWEQEEQLLAELAASALT